MSSRPSSRERLVLRLALAGVILGGFGHLENSFAASQLDLRIQFIGTDQPSSFPILMWVHVTNLTYTPLDLMERIATSELSIDGKLSPRIPATASEGPPGIAPSGDWSGCLSLDGYAPPMTQGKHKVIWRLGDSRSNEATVNWSLPVDWRSGTMKTRMKQVRDLAGVLKKGLPRTCVEQWLTEKDGGMQSPHRVRYYLAPQIKMLVPYSQTGQLGHEDEVIAGSVQVYQEARFTD